MKGFAPGLVSKQRYMVTWKWLFSGMFSNQSQQTLTCCFFNRSRARRKQLKSVVIWLMHVFPRFALVACSSGFRRLLWLVRFCYVWVWVYRIIRNNVGKSAYSFFGWERSEQNVKDTRQFRKLVWVEVECCCSFLKVMYQWKKSYRKMVICLENLMYPWNTSRAKVKICRFPLHPRNSCKQLLSKCGTVFSTRICCSCFRCQC